MLTRTAARAFSTAALKVVNDVTRQQFYVSLKGNEAFLNYEKSGKELTLVRTEVPDAFKGKGVGKLLAKHAFDYASENKLNVICQCHFLAHYYEQNKDNYKTLQITFDLDD
ncbi:unnamed protein product [Arctia plantaginis]|uniref:Protein NATD1 n=1 Tax=Arctia plantaginis TaxID=874455 RepID=A0A8S1A2Z6_ARCPL|nr:unnamed protein product [Arctia plantaginis]CAB3239029.1 unnamed protein product [Arctia plantaginis]